MASAHCAMYVRAIRLSVGKSGFVELVYKGSPSDPVWSGTDNDHYPNAEGFVILHSYPEGLPNILPHVSSGLNESDVRQLNNPKLLQLAESAGLKGSLSWLCEFITSGGIIPTGALVPDHQLTSKSRGWDEVRKIGVSNRTYDLPFMRPSNDMEFEVFWGLPTAVEQDRISREARIVTASTIR